MSPVPADATEQRKLAAIMFTDMVGYSALAQKDEALALRLLDEHQTLLRPFFPKFNGREVETIGDAFLVEFTSALDAVRCAIAIQKALAERNASSPGTTQIQIRIGIHVGDVVQREKNVLGDSVNIAARIEPLAKPGGICVTQQVFDQIHNKLEMPLLKLGTPELKNIQVPVCLYHVLLPWEATSPSPRAGRAFSETQAAPAVRGHRHRVDSGPSRSCRLAADLEKRGLRADRPNRVAGGAAFGQSLRRSFARVFFEWTYRIANNRTRQDQLPERQFRASRGRL